MKTCCYWPLFVLFLCSFQLSAEENDRWGFGFQPIIGYDDDASWTLGGNSVFYFNPNPADKSQELDELDLTTTVTLNGGANVHADYTKNLKGNNRILNTAIGCERYKDHFYGTSKESYTAVDVPFNASYSLSVLEHMYISAIYDFLYHDISGDGTNDVLLSSELMESDNTHCSGIGIGLKYTTTNPGIYKRKGYQIGLSSTCYSPVILSSSRFEITSLSYRYYTPLFSKCVLGFHLNGEMSSGDVPVNYLPSVGGQKLVRGFKRSRYLGKNCIAGQAEFRFPIWWRLGATVFLGAGEVANKFEEFGSNIKMAGGIGLRVAVQKKQNINIRFDLAYNSDGDLVKYIKIKEAF